MDRLDGRLLLQQRRRMLALLPLTMLLLMTTVPVTMAAAAEHADAAAADTPAAESDDAWLPPDWQWEELQQAATLNPRGAPLAEGVIRLSRSTTSAECLAHLNSTCFGRCLEAVKVTQLGPIHNISSVQHPSSPFWPPGSQEKRPCDCGHGYGLYSAERRTALWYFKGATEAALPRALNVSVADGKLVIEHAAMGARGCSFYYDLASGQCMGLKGAGGQPSPHAEFPLWATILLAIAGVMVLSGVAFVIIRVRAPAAGSGSSTRGRRRPGAVAKRSGGGSSSRAKVAVKVRAGNEAGEDVASLTDPLLLGEEGKADGGSS